MVKILLFLICMFVAKSNTFNIEERLPLVKRGPVGSLFGLSVAEHHLLANADSMDNAVLLVGAPVANESQFETATTVQPGALFSCSVSSDENDCRVVEIDNNLLPKQSSHQWLGVTIETQKPGGLVAVCAHRYTKRNSDKPQDVIWEEELGQCYILTRHLQLTLDISPCDGKDGADGTVSHENYGYCQAGTSVAFAKTVESDFIIGMPGLFFWTGGIESREFASTDFFAENLRSEQEDAEKFIMKNSYNGFAMASGTIFGDNINFVSGAPRANDTGVVVIYEKHVSKRQKSLKIIEIIHGEILASAFGYDISVTDITGDGRLDLIVGAPQYYDRVKKIGGAVYIYVNNGSNKLGPKPTAILYGEVESAFGNAITALGDINMDGANDIAIGAPGADDGAGAVYIFHGNNDPQIGIDKTPAQVIRGKTLNDTIQLNMIGFGYSVSGGLDMDFNGYPDLLVGSLGDFAVLYRSRPIVNVEASLTTSLSKININPQNNPNAVMIRTQPTNQSHKLVTFDLSICMNYTSLPTTFDESVQMTFTVKLDVLKLDNDLRPRLTFVPLNYTFGIKKSDMTLYPQSMARSQCVKYPIYLDNDMQDKLSPFVMKLSYNVLDKEISSQTSTEEVLSLNDYPIFNKKVINHTSTQVNISKNCGSDEICKSNLRLDAEYVVILSQKNTWQTLPNDENGMPELSIGTEKAIGLRIKMDNVNPGEDAHQANLKVMLPDFLQYIGLAAISPKPATVSCTTLAENSSVVDCNLGNPFRTDSHLSMIVKLGNDDRLYDIRQFTLYTKLSTSSTQDGLLLASHPVSVRFQVALVIEGFSTKDQVPFGGEVIGESAVLKPSDAGLPIQQEYEVENIGNTEITDVSVNISWPLSIKNGKWLFYLLSASVSDTGSNESRCYLPLDFNPLKLQVDTQFHKLLGDSNRRRKRGVESETGADTLDDKTSAVVNPLSTHTQLKCPTTAQCMNFKCTLGTLPAKKKVFIKLIGVSWNSTFLEEYFGVAEVRVYSSASVELSITNAKYSASSVLVAETSTSMLSEKVIAPEEQVKLWIIIVATLAGVILLVIIVVLLWRCGFFKRRRDYGDYHRARKHRQASQKADDTSDRILY